MMFPVSNILERMFCNGQDNGNYIIGVSPSPPSLPTSLSPSFPLFLSLSLSLLTSLSPSFPLFLSLSLLTSLSPPFPLFLSLSLSLLTSLSPPFPLFLSLSLPPFLPLLTSLSSSLPPSLFLLPVLLNLIPSDCVENWAGNTQWTDCGGYS